MHEHIARAMYYFSVHLLYASVVGVCSVGADLNSAAQAPLRNIGFGLCPHSILSCR